ncbi:hypothetical protein MPSEU_000406300 [Mayamaea pseudoterrestris]|nr:hypothetical protein MPSEU_000406300 [Mayamaea pseudoterrestris]
MPLHLQELLETVSIVHIVEDNARLPAQSATDEYYRNMSLLRHTRREPHTLYMKSPVPRRQKLRIGAKSSPGASPLGRQRLSVRSSLQQQLPLAPPPWSKRNKVSRWDNSSSDGADSLNSDATVSASMRPKMPVRSWKQSSHYDSPSVPVRKNSMDLSLSNVIEDMQLVYGSDDDVEDDDDMTNSTATINTMSPGTPREIKARIRDHLRAERTLPVQVLSNESTSSLIQLVIDDLKLYDDSESNTDEL